MNADQIVDNLLNEDGGLEAQFTPDWFEQQVDFNEEEGYSSWKEFPMFSGVECTGFACAVFRALGPGRVKIMGYAREDNPQALLGQSHDGHDFAVVDGRYIVDGWVRDIESASKRAVFDLQSPADAEEVRRLYGDPKTWVRLERVEAEI